MGVYRLGLASLRSAEPISLHCENQKPIRASGLVFLFHEAYVQEDPSKQEMQKEHWFYLFMMKVHAPLLHGQEI